MMIDVLLICLRANALPILVCSMIAALAPA